MVDIGDKLSTRYQIIDIIGSGGMANVYLAKDLILDRLVAVKVLRFDFQDNKDAIRRFQREAMSASQLLHHNIVEVYDVDEEDGQQYIVMEYVDGQDLKTFIRNNAPISLELAVQIMSQILSAIDVAHKNGIIHRDIKPQNILITEDNEVKITDFGIAIALTDTSITQTNTLLGSVHYLSPEQARGSNATPKSDIYALGVVLYELITGSVPFDGESAVSIALKHFQETFPRIRDQIDYVPQSLENVVLKATSKDPDDRYDSVQDMLNDLSTSLDINRMNESMFVPEEDLEQTVLMKPIAPIEGKSDQSIHNQPPEPLDEAIYPNYDEIKPLNQNNKKRKWLRLAIPILLFLLVASVTIFLLNQRIQYIAIPNVEEMTVEEATKKLQESNLKVKNEKYVWDDSIAQNHVIKTEPAVGQRVKRDSSIELVVSNGKQQVEIADYVGKDYETIRSLLTDAGFIVERRGMATSDPSQEGIILEQSISPGETVVPSQTSITLTVGSMSESVVMQDFYNLSLDMVYTFADEYGLNVNEEYEADNYISKGKVISQEPASGKQLNAGDTITVVVSSGSEKEEIISTPVEVYLEYIPTYDESDEEQTKPKANHIEVYIGDKNNNINKLAEEFDIKESRTIRIILYIPSNGTGSYRVLRDGEVLDESHDVKPAE